MERLRPHDLLRLSSADAVHGEEPETRLPEWAKTSLRRVPWVVVRRAYAPSANFIPVGVRGSTRGERMAGFVDRAAITENLVPEELVAAKRVGSLTRTRALRVVGELGELLCSYSWGPTGSVGFELASGAPTTNAESDLDIVIRVPTPLPLAAAISILEGFATLPVRVDAQLDTPAGSVSLREYARGHDILARTLDGPKIVRSPWQTEPLGTRPEGSAV